MALQSHRFRGNATLEACVSSGHRMLQGERDHDAVQRLQQALYDLGYDVVGRVDGDFGGKTAQAVVAFKTDEGLAPTDPVASTGTIGRLDQYFTHEVADFDFPDPAPYGLKDLTQSRMGDACRWLNTAIEGLLSQFPSSDIRPNDPLWVAINDTLERNFHISRASRPRAFTIDQWILPILREAQRMLSVPSPYFDIVPMDRAGFHAGFPTSPYLPIGLYHAGQLAITPAFRNALSPEEQAANLIRIAVGADDRLKLFAVPGSPRYKNLPGDSGLNNTMAFASFAFEMATGGSGAGTFHGHFTRAF